MLHDIREANHSLSSRKLITFADVRLEYISLCSQKVNISAVRSFWSSNNKSFTKSSITNVIGDFYSVAARNALLFDVSYPVFVNTLKGICQHVYLLPLPVVTGNQL